MTVIIGQLLLRFTRVFLLSFKLNNPLNATIMDAYDIFKKLTKGLTFKHRVLGVKNNVSIELNLN